MSLLQARTRVVVTFFVLALSVAACVSACASARGKASPGAPGTGHGTSSAPAGVTVPKKREFAPFDRSGAPTAGVVAHRSGSCFTTSITVSAKRAYRCFAANAILDPCFAVPGSRRVLDCYAAPWTKAVELRVPTLPKAAGGLDIARPWAVELADGAQCVATNGTPSVVRGVALEYQCGDGFAGLRHAATAGKPLDALYRATDGAVRTVAVRTVWHAT